MRVWDINPAFLCRNHLLGEHREIHAIYSILLNGKSGYRNHPEVKRWEGRLWALFIRHGKVAYEMIQRGYKHNSHMKLVIDSPYQDVTINTVEEQIQILNNKNCDCWL